MKHFLKNRRDKAEIIFLLLFACLWNQSVYSGARWIASSWHHYDMTTPFDASVPFLPWTISIYLGCYLFWAINYWLCARQPAAERRRFFCADMMAKGICFLLFLAVPTTNVRPEVCGSGVWERLILILYRIDAPDNLFPSIHCLVSWLCWTGIRKRKDIPAVYRHFSLAAALAVCVSTLTTRQHVAADAAGGILLAEACYYLAGTQKMRRAYSAALSRLLKIFPSS